MKALAPVQTAEPATPILSLADAKAQCRVLSSDEDDLIGSYADAAQAYLDGYSGVLGQALITQEWSQSFSGFPAADCFRLPLGPLQQVDSITYFDSDGASQTFTAFHEGSDAIGPFVTLQDGSSWPSTAVRPDAVTVAWTCGFGDAVADLPPAAVQAAKLLVAYWHLQREAVSEGAMREVPFAVNALIATIRKVGV